MAPIPMHDDGQQLTSIHTSHASQSETRALGLAQTHLRHSGTWHLWHRSSGINLPNRKITARLLSVCGSALAFCQSPLMNANLLQKHKPVKIRFICSGYHLSMSVYG
jgi:hypothetical protein